jgi:hypothetical protein
MLKRIFILVSRGMTDATAVCVFPWERPLVEEIHGGNAQVVSIDQLCNRDGVSKIQDVRKVVKLPTRLNKEGEEMVPDAGMTPRQQYERMTVVADIDNPMHDTASEWGRMIEKYGMHPEIKMMVVEKIYGNQTNFRKCMRDFAAGRTPEFLQDVDDDEIEGDVKAVSEMSADEMKAELKRKGIAFKKNASKNELEALLMEQAA